MQHAPKHACVNVRPGFGCHACCIHSFEVMHSKQSECIFPQALNQCPGGAEKWAMLWCFTMMSGDGDNMSETQVK